ncbi:MAG TPA: NapC/NirT family cytochrome c [Candidatus Paceibacterota bacterium]|nr:NapC/NirT family cytochrome c [Verrucomicrobiota bacterium]HRY47760.1 NapC/NirT family cytochrome c [Candidatus Paceibacterota bacterium]HSA03063.1 NapC/NirT family cytochrome c [Candidatus Paceibacterota bacterium]
MNGRWSPFRNWISLAGLVLAAASLFSFVLLFVIDSMAKEPSPYQGLLTFVVAPGFFVAGCGLMLLGWFFQRRYQIKHAAGAPPPFLSIDLSRPQDRRCLFWFAFSAVIFLLVAAVGSYHSYHYVESVAFCGQLCHKPMHPEYTTYIKSPHARVSCTECHVGPGAASFVKAKLNGVHQLYATLTDSFDRPIKTPLHAMREAKYTCENCHWPQKYIGNKEKTYVRYLSDETNTVVATRMLLKVGGGDPAHGPVGGIHWHMNLNNKVEYLATDDRRQEIPWVRLTNAKGEVTEYRAAGFTNEVNTAQVRVMDCIDCHNRPAHQYSSPGNAVDLSLRTGRLDPNLAGIKMNAVEALSAEYTTQAEARDKIAEFLKSKYPQEAKLSSMVAEVQQIYAQNIFPEMKASWKAYPDNIGHKEWPGCFRCHDGRHKTADGKQKIEASNCNDCHVILAQAAGKEASAFDPQGLTFSHPDPSDDGTGANCNTCHGTE